MSDLRTLKGDLKKKAWRNIAEDVIRYQNFKAQIAVRYMRGSASPTTKKNYLTAGRHYITTKEQYKTLNVGKEFYTALEEMLNKHIQPLIPKENEKARLLGPRKPNYTKKEAKVPITQIIPKKITSDFEYGVRYGKIIYLHDNDIMAKIFLDGIKATGNNAEIVSVEVQKEDI